MRKLIGDTNPKYYLEAAEGEKADYSQIETHPAYAATYTVPCLFQLGDVKGDDGQPIILNLGKLLHTGQEYDFEGCEPLKDGEKVYTKGKIESCSIKSDILWVPVSMVATNKEELRPIVKRFLQSESAKEDTK